MPFKTIKKASSDKDQRRLTCALQNMRMACNSTFLLDHETDHGNKVDELMTLLDDERPKIAAAEWAVCVSTFYGDLAERLVNGAFEAFESAGAGAASVRSYEVSGAFELPMAAKLCAESKNAEPAIVVTVNKRLCPALERFTLSWLTM